MSNRKLAKAIQQLFRQIWKLYRSLSKGFVTWLLRLALLPDRRRRRVASGFVLPTTVFLILVVTLTSGALTYRAFSNSARVIGNVQSKEVYNAATPAIDRARVKLESLFADPRYPGGVPSEAFLTSMMLNDGRTIKGTAAGTEPGDPFTLNGEVRVDVNEDGLVDNAWLYHDAQAKSTIVYSITFSTPPDDPAPGGQAGWQRLLTLNEQQKANGAGAPAGGPFVRSGPLGSQAAINCRVGAGADSPVEQGWYRDESSTSKLRKRFQVNAFVVKDDAVNPGKSGNFTTLEFAQDRLLDRGNKWGAWFRNDLEVYPGAQFNWNGAMHSEGSIFVGGNGNFNAYLISSPNSCLFLPETNSEISVRQKEPADGSPDRFLGVIGAALARDNTFGGSGAVHVYNGNSQQTGGQLTTTTHWVTPGSKSPIEIALNPNVIVSRDGYRARGGDVTNADSRLTEAQIAANPFAEPRRFSIDREGTRPYLDDTYRADNLYGPKKVYKDGVVAPDGRIGTPIQPGDENFDQLTRATPTGTDTQTVGADGYWERRAIVEGMRLLVGERLELGNPSGWVAPKNRPSTPPTAAVLAANSAYPVGTDATPAGLPDYATIDATAAASLTLNPNADNNDNEGDPLYPPYRVNDAARAHEERERKAVRDNLAAVQATAVYHYGPNRGTYPVACLATTAHPGTVDTLKRSVNFAANPYLPDPTGPWVDFFSGHGTNGWEFAPPATDETTFSGQLGTGQALGNALRNLANFAGDPEGAYPPQQGARVRPDSTLTMWGNFSNLRRAIAKLDGGGYNSLSPADKTYLQTASCTLGLLAHNINQVQNFNLAAVPQPDMFNLGDALFELIDGTAANGEVIPPLLPADTNYTARHYDNVTPAMMLAALKTNANSRFSEADRKRLYKLGVLIHEKFQIQRDRTYGFRPSPAANTWNYNPYLLDTFAPQGDTLPRTLWSSACDPTVFAPLVSTTPGAAAEATLISPAEVGAPSLGLSRLCGTVNPPGIFHNAEGDKNFPARGGATPVVTNLPQPTNLPDYQRGATATTNFAGVSATDDLQATVQPEFPALYYIFPELRHRHLGDNTTAGVDHRQPGNGALDTTLPVAFQPWREPYITDTVVNAVNGSFDYEVVGSGSVANVPLGVANTFNIPSPSGDPNIDSFNYRAIAPLPAPDVPVSLGVTPRTQGSWTTPTATPGANSPNRIVLPNGSSQLAIAFQDKVLFNGREWQPNRVLDLDLDLLRNATISGTPTADTWLPKSGIVYAFREDAMREDAISRPAGTTVVAGVQQTLVIPGNETDPPMTNGENSTKTVDYVADPDRRAHGFRLRNGERLKRAAAVATNENVRGLSFFSDDVVYIMGDFNRHQNAGGTLLEEFQEQLNGVFNEATFYGRSTRDPDFARAGDEWRPSEVLGDSVTILSRDFCDGSASDAFLAPRPSNFIPDVTQLDASIYNAPNDGLYGPGCTANGRTSFLNQNRPSRDPAAGTGWAREIPNDPESPVKVSRNGNPLVKAVVTPIDNPTLMPVEYAGRYNGGAVTIPGDFFYGSGPAANNDNLPGDRSVQFQPPETTVNTIMISGIVPSRDQQAYGGLHNFPRFLERWTGQNLRFSGSFIQLNFSNYSTAPYDQDVWEAGVAPTANEVLDYYQPPVRLWGYDVGLQIAPAGPAASRFVQLSSLRNEFYTEPPANDFYMQNLCRTLQQDAQTAPGAPNLSGLRCPA